MENLYKQIPYGNSMRGKALYETRFGCAACHGKIDDLDHGGIGPWGAAMWENAPRGLDLTKERYIHESIIYPNNYVVDGYAANVMPGNYSSRFSENANRLQEYADLIAYIRQMDAEWAKERRK